MAHRDDPRDAVAISICFLNTEGMSSGTIRLRVRASRS